MSPWSSGYKIPSVRKLNAWLCTTYGDVESHSFHLLVYQSPTSSLYENSSVFRRTGERRRRRRSVQCQRCQEGPPQSLDLARGGSLEAYLPEGADADPRFASKACRESTCEQTLNKPVARCHRKGIRSHVLRPRLCADLVKKRVHIYLHHVAPVANAQIRADVQEDELWQALDACTI
jgi:hypothetical protein